jgi:hypothetical protein
VEIEEHARHLVVAHNTEVVAEVAQLDPMEQAAPVAPAAAIPRMCMMARGEEAVEAVVAPAVSLQPHQAQEAQAATIPEVPEAGLEAPVVTTGLRVRTGEVEVEVAPARLPALVVVAALGQNGTLRTDQAAAAAVVVVNTKVP